MIESLDHGVGRVLATLDSLNLAEETIVVFYSDNGGHGSFQDLGQEENGITDNSPLKAGKGSFYEGGIRVPMIVRWPGVTEAGTQTDEPVTSIDFYPTLLAAAGIDRPRDYLLDGVNMMPVLRDPSASLDREALF
jgi:arylsulfatase A-like enzyme